MASITNHAQEISIYRMVLDRLPFIVDDCQDRFKEQITNVDINNNQLQVAGDFTQYMWVNQIQKVEQTSAELVVKSFSYDSNSDTTTITYVSLTAGQANNGNDLCIDGNYNEQLISRYIYQMMIQLQPCFQIDPESNIGNESSYTLLQKMIIADLVSWYILFRQALINSQGDGNESNPNPTPAPQRYIKSSKAGEVSVTWDYLKLKDSGYASLDTKAMMAAFKENAVCLANQLGCQVEVCADGSISCSCANNASPIVEGAILVASPLKKCKSKRNKYFL